MPVIPVTKRTRIWSGPKASRLLVVRGPIPRSCFALVESSEPACPFDKAQGPEPVEGQAVSDSACSIQHRLQEGSYLGRS